MVSEIKKFKWKCDCCNGVAITEEKNLWDSFPDDWIHVTERASSGYRTYDYHYCDECIENSKNHTRTEDNHYGSIIRQLEYDASLEIPKRHE